MTHRRRTIMIADDSAVNRKILQTLLSSDYTLVTTQDGEETLRLLNDGKQEISLLILDLALPKLSGYDVLRTLRADARLSMLPVIAITAIGQTDAEVSALDLGADDFITKPFDPRIIHHRVRNLVVKKELEVARMEDTIQHKHADTIAALDETRKTLETTTRELNLLLSNLPGGVAIVSAHPQLHMTYLNDTLAGYAGCTMEEFKAKYMQDLRPLIFPTDYEPLSKCVHETLGENKKNTCTFRIREKNGGVSWLRMYAVSINDSEIYCVFIDINSEKEQELFSVRAARSLRFRAEHDALTNIYNRETFFETTGAMLQKNEGVRYAVLCLSLTGYTKVCDIFGARAGNRLLCVVAEFLRSNYTDIGTFGIIGHNLFGACIPSNMLHTEQLLLQLTTRVEAQNVPWEVVPCVGVYLPKDEQLSVTEMFDCASLAVHMAKVNVHDPCVFYTPELHTASDERRALLTDAVRALDNGEFKLYLQSVYALVSGDTLGAEALVRWQHPTHGLLQPGSFLPLFEENGFIRKLDMHMFTLACEALHKGDAQGVRNKSILLNLSPCHFSVPEFAKQLAQKAEICDMRTGRIVLEVTMEAYHMYGEQFCRVIRELKDYGFRLALDHFDGGFAAANLLDELPFDYLVIPASSLCQTPSKAQERELLGLNAVLNLHKETLSVIACGVENEEQAELIRQRGCDIIQGYCYSHPVPQAEYHFT